MATMPKCYKLLHYSQEAQRQVREVWKAYHDDCKAYKEILLIDSKYFFLMATI